MAIVQGIREKVHLPIYDCFFVEPEKQLRQVESSSTLRFFVNVQDKTKLLTNLQSSSLLPHYNTFEARALRVVVSDLPPAYPDEEFGSDTGYDVTDDDDADFVVNNVGNVEEAKPNQANVISADLDLSLSRLVELLNEAKKSEEKETYLEVTEEGVSLSFNGNDLTEAQSEELADQGAFIPVSQGDLEYMIFDAESVKDTKKIPPREQIFRNNGSGSILSKLIYNTVTTFYVGEKVMIQMPTWFFPAGAGAYSEQGHAISHGEPSPMATFRFAEPIFIDRQQNFRVEIEIPDGDVLKELQRIYGPLYIWTVLDGFMTRGVQ
jgi:hypothetical protein